MFSVTRIPIEIALWISTPFLTLAVLQGLRLLFGRKHSMSPR
jgi:hypothetical protein